MSAIMSSFAVVGAQGPPGLTYLIDAKKSNDSTTVGITRTVLHSVSFTAPASGVVKVSGHVAAALSTFASLFVFIGIAAPKSEYHNAHINGISAANPGSGACVARFEGLTPGVSYTAVIEWQASAGTGTCNANSDPTKFSAYLLVEAVP